MTGIEPATLLNIVKVVVAMLCGGLIGLERARDQKPAGVRTQMLVAMGSALFMVVSMSMGNRVNVDPTRIAAQVVSGIGFLGAGAIIRERGSVMGMTTAASIWVTASIGLAIGAGMFLEGILLTIIAYLVLGWLSRYIKV